MKQAGMTFVVWTMLTAAALAQMEMPKPGPELKKLDVLAGSWTLDGDMKPGPMGPGGKMTEIQKCEWMDGAFFLICHADFKSSMGDGTGFSVMGYSKDDKAYTYREFNSWGEFEDSRGSLEGDIWVWTNDEKMEGTTMKGRFTMKMTSASSYDFTFEMSQDGTKWTNVMDGKATKGK
ncbi:MAG TPA: DUF1579 family protein [Candidatus Sulfotelmatobacter sp.]|nr:DUF1579 family protein [Candidatus Sulfotelmatobacter sp.]